MAMKKEYWNLIWASLGIILLILIDQLTKWWIRADFSLGESISVLDGFFNITYVRNTGAAFGMGAEFHDSVRRPLFLFIPVLACLWLVWLIWKSKRGKLLDLVSYSLILAGAVGNLIDRFVLGYVVDFLDFHHGAWHFPAFNIADSSITIAACLLIIGFIPLRKSKASSNVADTI